MRSLWFGILTCAAMLVACGGDDSDFATRPDEKDSSSSISPKSSDSAARNDGSEYDADKNTLTDLRDGLPARVLSAGFVK